MTLLEVIAYAPTVVSTVGALRALRGLVRRKPPGRPSASGDAPVWQVVRYEAADGGVLTVWTVGPARAAAGRGEEHGPW